VTVKVVVPPAVTAALEGDMVPPPPAVAVTVYCAVKLAVTVQFALTGPVVYVLPDNVPPQPVTPPTT